jgi:hypothetical protein
MFDVVTKKLSLSSQILVDIETEYNNLVTQVDVAHLENPDLFHAKEFRDFQTVMAKNNIGCLRVPSERSVKLADGGDPVNNAASTGLATLLQIPLVPDETKEKLKKRIKDYKLDMDVSIVERMCNAMTKCTGTQSKANKMLFKSPMKRLMVCRKTTSGTFFKKTVNSTKSLTSKPCAAAKAKATDIIYEEVDKVYDTFQNMGGYVSDGAVNVNVDHLAETCKKFTVCYEGMHKGYVSNHKYKNTVEDKRELIDLLKQTADTASPDSPFGKCNKKKLQTGNKQCQIAMHGTECSAATGTCACTLGTCFEPNDQG